MYARADVTERTLREIRDLLMPGHAIRIDCSLVSRRLTLRQQAYHDTSKTDNIIYISSKPLCFFYCPQSAILSARKIYNGVVSLISRKAFASNKRNNGTDLERERERITNDRRVARVIDHQAATHPNFTQLSARSTRVFVRVNK